MIKYYYTIELAKKHKRRGQLFIELFEKYCPKDLQDICEFEIKYGNRKDFYAYENACSLDEYFLHGHIDYPQEIDLRIEDVLEYIFYAKGFQLNEEQEQSGELLNKTDPELILKWYIEEWSKENNLPEQE